MIIYSWKNSSLVIKNAKSKQNLKSRGQKHELNSESNNRPKTNPEL